MSARIKIPARFRDGVGCVYFVQPEGGGLVKIGFTGSLRRRFAELQKMCPSTLVLLVATPGTMELEAEFHDRFASARRHGEWFSPIPEIGRTVRGLQKAARRSDVRPEGQL